MYWWRGMPSTPSSYIGMKVMRKPTRMTQKCHLPSRSDSMRPVIFGNQ